MRTRHRCDGMMCLSCTIFFFVRVRVRGSFVVYSLEYAYVVMGGGWSGRVRRSTARASGWWIVRWIDDCLMTPARTRRAVGAPGAMTTTTTTGGGGGGGEKRGRASSSARGSSGSGRGGGDGKTRRGSGATTSSATTGDGLERGGGRGGGGRGGGRGRGKRGGRGGGGDGAPSRAKALVLTEEEKAAELERSRLREEAAAKKLAEEEAARVKEAEARAIAEADARRRECELVREMRAAARRGNASSSRPDEQELKRRDSSIKKNTTVIKKLRTITAENKASMLQDLSKVNVSKYVTEAATACVEGKMKSSDVNAAVEIISCMHQTYGDFAAPLIETLSAYVLPPKPEKLLKMAEGEVEALPSPLQRRTKLRLFMELYLVGVCPKVDPILNAVKEIARLEYKTAPDLYQHSLSTLSSFAKTFSVEILGATPDVEPSADEFVVPKDVQKAFRDVLNQYCDRLFMVLSEAFCAVTAQEREMARLLERTGAISESASVEFAALTKVFDGLLKGATTLAEALGRELPEMKKEEEEKVSRAGTMELHRGGVKTSNERSDMWEDEEQQHFYETLPDLQASIPAVLLANEKIENETEAERQKRVKEEDKEGRSAKLEGLLVRLNDCMSKEKADAICTDFCYIGARGGRRHLAREFLNVRRSEIDRIPFYGRIISTLATVFDDIAPAVAQPLEDDFYNLVKKGKRVSLDERMKNIKFIGELIKFKVIPDNTVFEIIKVLLDDFHGDNVDVLCSLFDVSGYYLTKTTSTAKRMGSILDIFLRLKAVSKLDTRQCALVDSAYFKCRPVQRVIVKKVRPPMHEYVRHLIYSQLRKSSLEKVITQLLKLPWEDMEAYLLRKLLKVCKQKYSSVPLVATLIKRLSQYYPTLAVRALDAVLEDVRFGLEVNETWMHQRRVANMRLLGFLYKERIAHFEELLESLYLIISIGYDGRQAADPPMDTIRLRMVCTLLETAFKSRKATSFSRRKDIDKFLTFFQRYALTKDVPLDISNDVVEVMLSLNPRMKICETYEEANAECKRYSENPNAPERMETVMEEDEEGDGQGESAEDVEMEDEDSDGDDDEMLEGDSEADSEDESEDKSQSKTDLIDEDDEDDSSDSESESSEKEEEVKVSMKLKRATPQEERDFDREMNKFLGTSTASVLSNVGPRGHFNAAVRRPNIRSGGTIAFKMLVKSQGKQAARQLNVPEDAEFVANVKEALEAEQAELAEVRRKVLNMYEADEDPIHTVASRRDWRRPDPRRSDLNVSRRL